MRNRVYPYLMQPYYPYGAKGTMEDWITTGKGISFGERVKHKKTIEEFAAALQCKGVQTPKGQECGKYNTQTAKWEELLIKRYKQVVGEPGKKGFKELCKDICDLDGE